MVWVAPDVDRKGPPRTGSERDLLEAWLDFHRLTLQRKCAGLTAEQLAERDVPPSNLSLAGLVRHVTNAERGWFSGGFFGEKIEVVYGDHDHPGVDFDEASPATAERDLARFVEETERSRAATAGWDLDEVRTMKLDQRDFGVRWIYLHMIEEYARHNGHADLIRERIDGATGM